MVKHECSHGNAKVLRHEEIGGRENLLQLVDNSPCTHSVIQGPSAVVHLRPVD